MEEKDLNDLLSLPRPRFEAELPLEGIDLNPYQPRDPIGEEDGSLGGHKSLFLTNEQMIYSSGNSIRLR